MDEAFVYRSAASLATLGDGRIEPLADRATSRYSLLPSLWSVPFHAAGAALVAADADRDRWLWFATGLGSGIATAAAAAMLAAWATALDAGRQAATAAALLYAFASLALPYGSTLFSQVPAAPLVLAAAWAADAGRPWRLAWAWAAAVACRHELAALTPAFWIAVAWSDGKPRFRLALAALGGAASGLAFAAATHAGRGDPLLEGGYAGESFTTPVWVGLAGLLASSGKGLAFHAPVGFLGLLLAWGWAGKSRAGRIVLLVVLAQLLATAKWWAWHGAQSWGPRLLLPVLPLLFLPVADWLKGWPTVPRWQRRGFVLLAVAGVVGNGYAALQPLAGYVNLALRLRVTEAEINFLPNVAPWAWPAQPCTAWLWQAPGSPATWAWRIATTAVPLAALALLASRQRWRLPPLAAFRLPAAAAALAAACHAPDIVDGQWRLAREPAETQQLARLEPSGPGRWSGRLHVPNRGVTWFAMADDPRRPAELRLAGPRGFAPAPWHAPIELSPREYPLEIVAPNGLPGPICWTLPGDGQFRSAIPPDCLLPPQPTAWDRFRVQWLHWSWALWMPAALALAAWFVWPEDASHGSA